MPRIILACMHQIFISQQRRLKVSLFPSQTMESSSLGDRSSSLGSCACHPRALGTKADTAKNTIENCHGSSARFSAHFPGRNSAKSLLYWVRDRQSFCSQDLHTLQTQSTSSHKVGQHKFLTMLGQTDVQRAVEWRS